MGSNAPSPASSPASTLPPAYSPASTPPLAASMPPLGASPASTPPPAYSSASKPAPASSPASTPPIITVYSPPAPPAPDGLPSPPSAESAGTSSHAGLVAGIVVAVVLVMAIAAGGFILFLRDRRRKLKSSETRSVPPPPTPPEAPDQPLRSQLNARSPVLDSAGLQNYLNPSAIGPSCFAYQQLCEATQNFHSSRFLGKGGFGPVYKGDINGEFVAVKCLNNESKQGFKEFRAEINIISDLRHRNLVRLRGWCYEDNKYFLVYDFVARGSLDAILFDDERCRSELSWERRFGIVLGLSSALQYLHEDCDKVIIHRDIKTSNVLVDERYVAKLGDFGLSRDVGDSETFTTEVAGTQGYIAPEVFLSRKPSKESDIYSFGAVLAEIACGKRVIDRRGLALVDWIWSHLPTGTLMNAADERLSGDFNEEHMARVLLVALACSHPDPSARPPIRLVMEILRGTAALPSVPLYKPIPVYMASSGSGSNSNSSSYIHGTTSTSNNSSLPNYS